MSGRRARRRDASPRVLAAVAALIFAGVAAWIVVWSLPEDTTGRGALRPGAGGNSSAVLTIAPAKVQGAFTDIEMFYNPKGKHVRNGMLSPVEYEQQSRMQTEGVIGNEGLFSPF